MLCKRRNTRVGAIMDGHSIPNRNTDYKEPKSQGIKRKSYTNRNTDTRNKIPSITVIQIPQHQPPIFPLISTMQISPFIRGLPKAELHVHIEGTFEPELMLSIARRNGITLPFATVDDALAAYQFSDLQDFLDIYYQGVAALLTERDFCELTRAYLDHIAAQNVRHAEIFFDPQAHTVRGIPFATVCRGIQAGLRYGEQLTESPRASSCASSGTWTNPKPLPRWRKPCRIAV